MRTAWFLVVALLCVGLAAQQAQPPAGVPEVQQSQLERLPSSPKVSYPAGASMESVQGVVVLGVTISPEGTVEKVDILDGPGELAGPTAKTVAKWAFKPLLDGSGAPQRVYSKFTFNFAFHNKIKDNCSDNSPAPVAPPEGMTVDRKVIPQRVRVSQGVSQGLLCRQVAPVYPPKARERHIQGTVVLKAVIGRDGYLKEVEVLSGPLLLVDAATAAVRQWRYRPYKLYGSPVEVETQITVNFILSP